MTGKGEVNVSELVRQTVQCVLGHTACGFSEKLVSQLFLGGIKLKSFSLFGRVFVGDFGEAHGFGEVHSRVEVVVFVFVV